MATKRINLWSGPRNVSTALMYSFAQRADTKVVDEPFYAHYLSKADVNHPGREEVLESQPREPQKVIDNLLSCQNNEVLFIKNMAHHMIDMSEQLERMLNNFTHVFLIRDPYEMLLSLSKNLPNLSMRDTAYRWQLRLFEMAKEHQQEVHIIDSKELLTDPAKVLEKLCVRLGLSFDEKMLRWEAGPIPEEGIWAKYWYDSVHTSTKFNPYEPKTEPLPEHLKPLYEKCKSIYDQLNQYSIKA